MTDLRKTAMDIAEASQTQWPDELADAIHKALEAARDEALAWRPIETAPRDGEPILIARHYATWGWIRGWAEWVDIRGISGWVSHGFYDPPGELGLADPSHWQPIPAPLKSTPQGEPT